MDEGKANAREEEEEAIYSNKGIEERMGGEKMRARICEHAIKSPKIISITDVSPWGMPVRECP